MKRLIKVLFFTLLFAVIFYTSASAQATTSKPQIDYVSKSIILGESEIIVGGRAQAGSEININLKDNFGDIITNQKAYSDDSGNWNTVINAKIDVGEYHIYVSDKQSSSTPIISDAIKVRVRPSFVVGSFEINEVWFFMGLLLLLVVTFVAGWSSYDSRFMQINNRVIVAKRDVDNLLSNIDKRVDELVTIVNEESKGKYPEIFKQILLNIKEDIEKAKKYIIKNILDIKR